MIDHACQSPARVGPSSRPVSRSLAMVAGAVLVSASIVGCSNEGADGFPSRTVEMNASEQQYFQTEAALTAAADIVVVGEVTAVTPTRIGGSEGDSPLQVVRVDLKVRDILKGEPEDIVGFEWLAWTLTDDNQPDSRLIINGLDTPRVGEVLVVWLEALPIDEIEGADAPSHGLVSFDGILRVEVGGLSTTLEGADRLAYRLADLGLERLIADVRA